MTTSLRPKAGPADAKGQKKCLSGSNYTRKPAGINHFGFTTRKIYAKLISEESAETILTSSSGRCLNAPEREKQAQMDEEYTPIEESQQSPEFYSYSEFNDESRIGEHEQYALEDSYVPREHQSYQGDRSAERLSRHSSVLRNNRNRLGRLLAMLAAVAGPALIIILLVMKSVFVEVTDYRARPKSLEVFLTLYSSSSETEFNAVLSDRDGNLVSEQPVSKERPELLFIGLEPGGFYRLEVFADGESKLRLNYILPEEELPVKPDVTQTPEPSPTAGPTDTGEGPTGGPTGAPTDVPVTPAPALYLAGEEKNFESFTISLSAENIDTADLKATVDGKEAEVTSGTEAGTLAISADGLTPDTEYKYAVTDKDGNVLLEGTVRTDKRTPAEARLILFSSTMTSADAEFIAVNPDGNKLSAKLDGADFPLSTNTGMLSFKMDGLEESSSHVIDIYDWDGTLVLSYSFTTKSRNSASVTLSSESYTLNSAALSFTITNPDKNALTVKYDSATVEQSLTAETYNFSRTGLNPGESHMLEFYDYDGTLILSYPFSASSRRPAGVSLSSESYTLNSATLSFTITNPDKNALTVKYDSATVEQELTAETYNFSRTGLNPGESHMLEFYDWDGTLILSYPFSANGRRPASVSLSSQNVSFDRATVNFSITNPDGNQLTVKYDGSTVERAYTGTSYTLTRTGLTSGQNHTVEFVDWDGTTIFTHTFAARERTSPTVSLSGTKAGYNTVTVKVSVTSNPDGNQLELRLNGNKVNADLTSSTFETELTGLSPRTSYTITVRDLSKGANAATTTVTTVSSVTVSQDGSGNATFTLTDEFYAAYPRAMITLTDSLGQKVSVTSRGNGVFYAAANDLTYADTYTLTLKSGNSSVDTVTSSLSGKTRPVFTLTHYNYGPAKLDEARTSEYHESYISYPYYYYNLKKGYVEKVTDSDHQVPEGLHRWTALIIKDSSGKTVGAMISGLMIEDEETELNESMRVRFEMSDANELTAGTYTAALYTADGLTEDNVMALYFNAFDEDPQGLADFNNTFITNGRRITENVSFKVQETAYKGDGFIYDIDDPANTGSAVIYNLAIYYYKPEDVASAPGYLAIVSAADPTVNLIDPILIGTEDTSNFRPGRLTVNTLDPVYIIIYTGTFSPENYLYVRYATAP